MKILASLGLLALAGGFAVAGCSAAETEPPAPATPLPAAQTVASASNADASGESIGKLVEVTADIIDKSGVSIGSLTLVSGPNGLVLRAQINAGGLDAGWHGLHLHQVADCSDLGVFKKSGGHVGMVKGGHGLFNPSGPEGGDLPNIWAAADGSAGYEAFTTLTSLTDLTDADGAALIIHQNADDHITQPIGGAGSRVACAAINAE